MSVYYLHAWCPRRPDEGVRDPGTIVTKVVSHHVGTEN